MTDRIAIVGAGPAGLMAAEVLSTAGVPVTLYDRMPTAGRKFLLAGRGGLNLTHTDPRDTFLTRYGDAAPALTPLIDAFPPAALQDWCEALGVPTFFGSSGRVFPSAFKASPLLRAWLRRLDAQGVRFAARHTWTGWDDDGALVFAGPGDATSKVAAPATILALGGASWPHLGSDGRWVPTLRQAGIAVADLAPANCGCDVVWSPIFRQRHEGQPLKRITLSCGGHTVTGEAVVTARGLEGGAVYALAAHIRAALADGAPASLTIDLRPALKLEQLAELLARPRGKQSLANHLRKVAHLSPAAIGLLREDITGTTLPSEPRALAARIKAVTLTVRGVPGLDRAISSAGGVAWSAVDERLMLRDRPGVFLAGEMLDWEAPTGGYLLQACISTGRAAAIGVLRHLGLPAPTFTRPDHWEARDLTQPSAAPVPADGASEPAA